MLKCHYVLLDASSRKADIQNAVSKHSMTCFEWHSSQRIFFIKSAALEDIFLTSYEIREEVSDCKIAAGLCPGPPH